MTSTPNRVVAVADGAEFRDIGGTIKRLIHPDTVGQTNIGLSLCVLQPGEEVVIHRHPSEEAYFVVEGEGEMYLEDHPDISLHKDIAVYIPGNAMHGQKNTGHVPLVIVAVLSPPLTSPPEFAASE